MGGFGLPGDRHRLLLVTELRQHLDQLLKEQVARGQQKVQQDERLERAHEERLRAAEQPLDSSAGRAGPLLAVRPFPPPLPPPPVRRLGDLLDRLSQVAQPVLHLRQALRSLGDPLSRRLRRLYPPNPTAPSRVRITRAAPAGSGSLARLRVRTIGLSRKSSRTARTMGRRNARAKYSVYSTARTNRPVIAIERTSTRSGAPRPVREIGMFDRAAFFARCRHSRNVRLKASRMPSPR